MKQTIRIPKGYVNGYNPLDMVDKMKDLGLTEEDIRKHSELEFDYSSCYYEGDTPEIICSWGNIFP